MAKSGKNTIWTWLGNPVRALLRLFDTKTQGGVGTSIFAKLTGSELTGAEEEANAFQANEAQKNRDFQQQMSDTSYQRAVTDMQNAGLNPALLYGSGSNGASTPSGSMASSVSPSSGSNIGDILQLLSFKKMLRNTDADTAQKSAEAFKAVEEGKDVAKNAEVRSEKLNIEQERLKLEQQAREDAHNLNDKQIEFIDSQRNEIAERIKTYAAEIGLRISQAELAHEQALLAHASAYQIYEMVPYQQALMSSQTSEASAQSALLLLEKGYKQHLFTDEYVDALIDKAISEATDAEARAGLSDMKRKIRTGEWSENMNWFEKWNANSIAVIANAFDIFGGSFLVGLGKAAPAAAAAKASYVVGAEPAGF